MVEKRENMAQKRERTSRRASGSALATFQHHACARDIDLVTRNYARDCMAVAAEMLAHVGSTRVNATAWEDILSCVDGDQPVTVRVLPVPIDGFALSLENVESLAKREIIKQGCRRAHMTLHQNRRSPIRTRLL